MRSIFTLILISMSLLLSAKPAKRVLTKLTQPDGSIIMAMPAGDEFYHYYIDINNGNCLKQNEKGEWVKFIPDFSEVLRKEAKTGNTRSESAANAKTIGNPKHLLILVEFTNYKFSEIGTKERFEEFVNGENYTFQGATGSVKQYFKDQSFGLYDPTFDVVGPICVDSTYQYYGADSNRMPILVEQAVYNAYSQGLISDFSQYDHDNNGTVDLVYVITAGYSEAENTSINKDWPWPHQWYVYNSRPIGDTSIYKYAFSTELQNTPESTELELDGIGTMAHEFSHVLGLPDFYNTGSKTGCYGMDSWSVMDSGCYNNSGRTPTSYTAYERAALGWCQLDTLPAEGEIVLEPFSKSNKAYIMTNPENSDEYFTFEYHNNEGWDEYWGFYHLHGMLVTHVDYNKRIWSNNTVNNDPEHQRCSLVAADGELIPYDLYANKTYSGTQWRDSFYNDIFPGTNGYSSLVASENSTYRWFNGPEIKTGLYNIKEENDRISFTVSSNGAPSAIVNIVDSSSISGIYDLNGRKVANNINSLSAHGVFIIKDSQGNSSTIIR